MGVENGDVGRDAKVHEERIKVLEEQVQALLSIAQDQDSNQGSRATSPNHLLVSDTPRSSLTPQQACK